jgi:hypothetical protein
LELLLIVGGGHDGWHLDPDGVDLYKNTNPA